MKPSEQGSALTTVKLNKGQKAILTVALYFALFAVIRLFIKPYYELPDDFIFAEYIAGGYYNLVFTNYFLVRAIAFVQDIIYPHNAYVLIYMAVMLFAVFALIKLFAKKYNVLQTVFIVTFLFSFLISTHILVVSFTRLPALLVTTGAMYLFYYYYQEKRFGGYACGIVLILLGAMYRFSAFEAAGAVCFTFAVTALFVRLLKSVKEKKAVKDFVKENIKPLPLAVMALTVILAFSINTLSAGINTSTDKLRYYKEYNSARSALTDYELPSYEEEKEAYDKIGIDKNDLIMLDAEYMDDEGAFTLEKIQAIRDIKDEYYKSQKTVSGILKSMTKDLAENFKTFNGKAVLFLTFLTVLAGFLLVQKRLQWWIPAGLCAVIFALNYYIHILGRSPYRAIYPIWAPAIILLLFSLDKKEKRKWFNPGKIKPLILVPFLAAFIVAGLFVNLSTNEVFGLINNSGERKTELSEYINANKDKDFELTGLANLFEGNRDLKNIYYIKKFDKDLNYKIFNATYYRTSYDEENMKMILNTDNMFKNLVNDNVYFVGYYDVKASASPEVIKNYLEKYYFKDKTVKYRVVKEFEVFTVYDFYLE